MSNTFDSSVCVPLNATTIPFVIVDDPPSNVAAANTQEVEGDNGVRMTSLFYGIH